MPVPNASQAVVANQLVAVVKRMTRSAVASLPPARRVQRTAEASVHGTAVISNKPIRRSVSGRSQPAQSPSAGNGP